MPKYNLFLIACLLFLVGGSVSLFAQTHDDDVFTIIGDADLLNGAEWNPDASFNDMTQKGDIYELTVKNRYLVKTSSSDCHERYRYAVVRNHDLTDSYPNILTNGAVNRSRGKSDDGLSQTGYYDIVFTYNPNTNNLTANFILVKSEPNPTFTVTLTVNNSSLGTVTGGGTYECGKSVSIKAVPGAGNLFSGWSDGSTSASRTIYPQSDTTIQAIFTTNSNVYTMVGDADLMNNNAEWDATQTANDMTLQADGTYQLTVKNKYLVKTSNTDCHGYYYFSVVSDHDITTGKPNVLRNGLVERTRGASDGGQIKQTGMYDITFSFTPTGTRPTASFTLTESMPNPVYTVNITSNDDALGSVTGGGSYECGQGITIKATPTPGSTFVQWSDGNKSASRTIYPDSDTDIYAIFQVNDNSYTIIGDPEVTNENADWDPSSIANQMTLLDDGTYQLIVKNKYLVKTSSTYCHDHYYCAVVANHDMSTVKPTSVYRNDKMYRTSGTSDGSQIKQTGYYDITYTFTATASRPTITYTLIESRPNPTFNVTLEVNDPLSGSVTGSGTYECGQSVSIKATPATGCTFNGWSDNTTTSTTRTIYPSSDTTIVATFSSTGYVLIGDPELFENGADWDATAVANKMILQDDGTYQLVMEDRYLVKTSSSYCHDHYYFAVAQNGDMTTCKPTNVYRNDKLYRTSGVSDGSQIKQTGKYRITFTYKEGDTRPAATFTLVESMPNPAYNVTILSADETQGTVEGTNGEYECGQSVSIKAVAAESYKFVKWSDGSTAASRTVYVSQDTNLVVYFQPYQWTVMGDLAIVNGTAAFNPNEPLNDMELGTKNTWTLIVENKVLTTCNSPYQYRVILNHDVSQVRPTNTMALLNITQNGLYNITFSYRENNTSPTVTTELLEEYGKDDKFTFDIQVSNTAYGTVSGSGEYNCGEVVSIQALAYDGYVFKQWSDGDTNPKRDVLADRDLQLTAVFVCASDDCSGPKEVYLDYNATSVPEQYKDAQPTWTAYPPALEGKIKEPDCK